jgi:hypothetical protein
VDYKRVLGAHRSSHTLVGFFTGPAGTWSRWGLRSAMCSPGRTAQIRRDLAVGYLLQSQLDALAAGVVDSANSCVARCTRPQRSISKSMRYSAVWPPQPGTASPSVSSLRNRRLRTHLGDPPEVQVRHQQPGRAAVDDRLRFALILVDNPGLAAKEVG